MPLQDHMKLFSTDDHVVEHGEVWQSRLPSKFRDRGLKLVDATEGMVSATGAPIQTNAQVWVYDGNVSPTVALNAVAGRPPEEFGFEPYRLEHVRPGCYDPKARLLDMDLEGVHVQTCFPTVPGHAGSMFMRAQDKELALLSVQAYNDFMVDEWCAADPERFTPLVMVPLWDPKLAAAEVVRTAAKGAKAITFPESLNNLGAPSIYSGEWDPFFAAAQEAKMPICLHFGTSGSVPESSPGAPEAVWIATMATNSMIAMTDWVFSPIFHNFPGTRIVMSEGGIGWMAFLLERLDYTWERHRWYQDLNRDIPPSKIFAEHIWGAFISDRAGIAQRHEIGVDRITWESDYPHSDSNFPASRKHLAEELADVSDEDAHRIAELNARELFGMPG